MDITTRMIQEAFRVFHQCEYITSTKSKESILATVKDNTVVKTIASLTYDWRLTYGAYPSPGLKPTGRPHSKTHVDVFQRVVRLAGALSHRKITGNAARHAIDETLRQCDQEENNWYTRLINRDLRVGVGVKTVLKVWPDLFPEFGVQLAKALDPKETLGLTYPVLVEPKLDGRRYVVMIRNGQPTIYSRKGIEYPIWTEIFGAPLAQTCRNGVFDGEVIAKDWNTASSIMTRKILKSAELDVLAKQVRFVVFDFIPLADFDAGSSNLILGGFAYNGDCRRKRLQACLDKLPSYAYNRIRLMPQADAQDEIEVHTMYDHYLSKGYEGIMVKTINGLYLRGEPSRSRRYWFKLKPRDFSSGTIVDVVEGQGKYTGLLGAFVVQTDDGQQIRVGGSYRSSLTDAKRKEFWHIRKDLPGKVIEYIHEDEDHTVAIARYPHFVCIREDL